MNYNSRMPIIKGKAYHNKNKYQEANPNSYCISIIYQESYVITMSPYIITSTWVILLKEKKSGMDRLPYF